MTELPTSLLPNGALSSMRNTAAQFMTQPIEIYTTTLSYDAYGQQVVTSGLLYTTVGYFGSVKGSDKELLSQSALGITRRDGVKIKTDALVLLPIDISIENDTIIRANGKDWHVVWSSSDTQGSVKVYTKAIVVQYAIQDERLNP